MIKVALGKVSLLVTHFSFSLVSTSPPVLYIHLYPSVAFSKGRNGRNLGAFQKVTLFWKWWGGLRKKSRLLCRGRIIIETFVDSID